MNNLIPAEYQTMADNSMIVLSSAVISEKDLEAVNEVLRSEGASVVCVPPCMVAKAKEIVAKKNRITAFVGGFYGHSTIKTKAFEAKEAIKNGAGEIVLLLNMSVVKAHDYDRLKEEIAAVKKACGKTPLSICIEMMALTIEERISVCTLASSQLVDYLMTSVGICEIPLDEASFKSLIATADGHVKLCVYSDELPILKKFFDGGSLRVASSHSTLALIAAQKNEKAEKAEQTESIESAEQAE